MRNDCTAPGKCRIRLYESIPYPVQPKRYTYHRNDTATTAVNGTTRNNDRNAKAAGKRYIPCDSGGGTAPERSAPPHSCAI